MIADVGLVGCSSVKLDRAAPARELYTSDLFRKSLAYAEAWCRRVYVLSALHGLVALDQVIEPYDVTLTTLGERLAWSARTAAELAKHHGPRAELVFLAGGTYANRLVDTLVIYGFARERMHLPLARLQVGQRLRALKHGLAVSPRELGSFVALTAQGVSIE